MDSKIKQALKWIGLGFLEPLINLIRGKEVQKNTRLVLRQIVVITSYSIHYTKLYEKFSFVQLDTASDC